VSANTAEIARRLARIHKADGEVSDVALLASGYDADIYAFALSRRDAPPLDLVLRVYGGEGAREKAEREFTVLRRLHQVGYPVPEVRRLERDLDGQPAVEMERIDGGTLDAAFWSAPAGERGALVGLHVELMARLHALDAGTILPGSAADGHGSGEAAAERLAFLSRLLARLEGEEPASLRAALSWLEGRAVRVPCPRVVVVHGDFHRNNVLVRPDGAALVIDWSNVRAGDPRAEVAWTRLIASAGTGPEEAQEVVRRYEETTGASLAEMEWFEAAACLHVLGSTLAALRYGARRQGMRSEAEALIRRGGGKFERWVAGRLAELTGAGSQGLRDALDRAFEAAGAGD
jgi:aminoglycoside phosphotransferase (APT) family kinase protein